MGISRNLNRSTCSVVKQKWFQVGQMVKVKSELTCPMSLLDDTRLEVRFPGFPSFSTLFESSRTSSSPDTDSSDILLVVFAFTSCKLLP